MPAVNRTAAVCARLAAAFESAEFTAGDAAGVGITRSQLRTAVLRGFVSHLRHGVYVLDRRSDEAADSKARHFARARAVTKSTRDAVVSHESAALLHGLPFPNRNICGRDQFPVRVTIANDHHGGDAEFVISGSRLPPRDVIDIDGVPVTSLSRTAIDIARLHQLPDGLMTVDAAARSIIERLACPAENPYIRDLVRDPAMRSIARRQLQVVVSQMRGWKGVGHARAAVAIVEPAAESALESISRFRIIEAGLPIPMIGYPVRGASGMLYWADMYWPTRRIIGEADGALKYSDARATFAERRREEDLRTAGFAFVRWNWDEAVVRGDLLVSKLRHVLG